MIVRQKRYEKISMNINCRSTCAFHLAKVVVIISLHTTNIKKRWFLCRRLCFRCSVENVLWNIFSHKSWYTWNLSLNQWQIKKVLHNTHKYLESKHRNCPNLSVKHFNLWLIKLRNSYQIEGLMLCIKKVQPFVLLYGRCYQYENSCD